MGEDEVAERARRREGLARARKTALRMLRSGKSTETVVAHLQGDGIDRKAAQRLVERVDDRLQEELHGGKRAEGGCAQCGEAMPADARFCEHCGAKVLDEHEQDWHRTQIEPHLVKGRKWIGAVAILYALGGIVVFALTENGLVMGVNFALALIQTGLWFWAKSSLLPAAVTSLVLFVTVHLASAVIDPSTIVSGIFIKVVFVMVLLQTIRAGLQVRSLRAARA